MGRKPSAVLRAVETIADNLRPYCIQEAFVPAGGQPLKPDWPHELKLFTSHILFFPGKICI